MELPSNFIGVYELVKQKENVITLFQQYGIIHQRKQCKHGHEMKLNVKDTRERWRCNKRECRISVQLRSNTWLNGSKLDLRKVLLYIYCWSVQLASIKFCERELSLNHNTAVDWSNYLREVCANKLLQSPRVIGGKGLMVEIDESLFRRRKYDADRIPQQQWVFGGICRETREAFLFAVDNIAIETVLPIIIEYIAEGSIIVSDKWTAYNGIRNSNKNCNPHSANFSDFINPMTSGALTKNTTRLWGAAKRRFRQRHGTQSAMMGSYMCEFLWRHNLPNNANAFEAILKDIASFWPPS